MRRELREAEAIGRHGPVRPREHEFEIYEDHRGWRYRYRAWSQKRNADPPVEFDYALADILDICVDIFGSDDLPRSEFADELATIHNLTA